ncbi:hypothetical protein [Blastococcus sp. SYSU DS0973]
MSVVPEDDLRAALDKLLGEGRAVGDLGAVIDGSLLLALVGLISIAPPCVLPLVPGYLLLGMLLVTGAWDVVRIWLGSRLATTGPGSSTI